MISKSHALSLYKKAAVYSFIPKNACSTLRYSVAIENECLPPGGDINWIHANNATFSVTLQEALLAKYRFVVLRCPFRRLASVFLDKIVNKEAPTAWTYYSLIGRERSLDDVTFEYFINSLLSLKLLKHEIHWRPQVDFLLYEEYSDVFCVERFSSAIQTLKEKIDFDVFDARELTKHGSDRYSLIEEGLWHDVPVKELYSLKMAGRLPSVEGMYPRHIYSAVLNGYKNDVELYSSWCNSKLLLKP
ncbi:sulfotransferase family protein [Marinimicrobium sp. C6131]|uniref:sulfotransferase family 2 domain-containing protein n=1 Tax=Marinimicrobium sp. C6131 TaxID=3022676 RepID=UPI00223CF6E6|nr:sulfotransferase family 2 domain-containing protein [Marinimicrobium sp. C6131]UZJ45329.1 sulfotransferase family protein [Marinimicrobium sp. C6131]